MILHETHYHPPHAHFPDPSDFEPIIIQNINKAQSREPILVPTSIKGRPGHSQFDPSLPLPKSCKRTQPETSLTPPKFLTITAL